MRPVVFLCALALLYCSGPKEEQAPKERPRVTVQPLRRQDWAEKVVVPVTVTPAAMVYVVARVPGKVRQVRVEEGDEVEAGDVLLVLDTRDLAIAVRQSEGQVALAKANLQAARVQRDTLEKDFRRFQELEKSRSVSAGDLEKLEAQFKAAQAQVELAEAQVKVAEAALALARSQLQDAVVRAPIGGVVVKRGVDVGQETAPGSANPLVTLAAIDPVRLEGSVPEYLLGRLTPGMEVMARFDSIPDETFSGKITLIGPSVDAISRQVRVRVEMENPKSNGKRRLILGMSGTLEITPASGQYFIIPLNAVRRQEGENVVLFFVDKSNKVYEKAIRPLRKEGLKFLALEGLDEGEFLVTAGPKELAAGDIVEVFQR